MDDEQKWDSTDDFLVHCQGLIDLHGWMVQVVSDDSAEMPFAYTVGLCRKGLPEFVTFGLPADVAQAVLNTIATGAASGNFGAGDVLTQVTGGGYDPVLIDVTDSSGVLRVANRLYGQDGPVAALQAVWPDAAFRFPWEPGAGQAAMPILGPIPNVGLAPRKTVG